MTNKQVENIFLKNPKRNMSLTEVMEMDEIFGGDNPSRDAYRRAVKSLRMGGVVVTDGKGPHISYRLRRRGEPIDKPSKQTRHASRIRRQPRKR